MKVTIKEWNAVASWRWDMPEDEVCGICRVQFDGTCPTCKYPGDDCALRESSQMNLHLSLIELMPAPSDWDLWALFSHEFEWKKSGE
ncbi:anaphase-promoting complex subunit 11, partial [Lecanoromycetidae sp. Uapishka_2]